MRLVSSFLPKAAIEVVVCSKYFLEVIVLAFVKLLSEVGFSISVSSVVLSCFCLKFRIAVKASELAYYWPKIFLSFLFASDNVWLWKQKS